MSNPVYSVVIPVFNSAQSLNALHSRLQEAFAGIEGNYEIIFVDDASEDKSWEALTGIKQQGPGRIKLVRLARNYGQHNATLCGMAHSSGSYIITMDDDLQHEPGDISSLIEKMKATGSDVIYAVPQNYPMPTYRRAGSHTWKFITRSMKLGYGNGSSFRLIKKDIVDKLVQHRQNFVFIDQLLFWYTQHTEFVRVTYYARNTGRSGYSPLRLFFLASNLVLFSTTLPLKWMTWSGIILSFTSLLLGIYFIIRKLFFAVHVEGFTALIVTILFTSSIMLLCFGIMGEYLARIYSLLNEKPVYSIRERLL